MFLVTLQFVTPVFEPPGFRTSEQLQKMQVRVSISARVPWISVVDLVDLVVLVVFPLAFQRLGDFVGLESRNSETNTVFFGNLHGIMVISIGKISITMILPW